MYKIKLEAIKTRESLDREAAEADARDLLRDTREEVLELLEAGLPVPADLRQRRAQARATLRGAPARQGAGR